MMMEQTKHSSFISQALGLYFESWVVQGVIYGVTFFVALLAALIADLGLGQPASYVALFTFGLIAALLLLVPMGYVVIRENWRAFHSRQDVNNHATNVQAQAEDMREMYVKLEQELITLQQRVNELTEKAEVALQPYEIPLSEKIDTDLGMLVSAIKAPSMIHYIQDLIYTELTDLRLESTYTMSKGASPRTLTLPAGMKRLLEQLGKAKGFSSGEDYLESVIRKRVREIQELDEIKMRQWEEQWEERRKEIRGPVLPYSERDLPSPSKESPSIYHHQREFNSDKPQPPMAEHPSGSPEEI